MARKKTTRIVVYKIKSSFKLDEIDLENSGYQKEYENGDIRLFVKSNQSKPSWINFLSPYITDADELVSQRLSFVLLRKCDDGIFALAGGSGYHSLKEFYEEEFGLQVAVRVITEDQIKSLNQKPLKGATRQIFRAVQGYNPSLDRSNYNRILKFLEGKGEFEGRTFNISGRTSLVLRTEKPVSEFDQVIREICGILEREEQVKLPKSYRVVKDEGILDKLGEALKNEFAEFWEAEGSRDSFYLEFDNPIDQIRAAEFEVKYKRKAVKLDDFDLTKIREKISTVESISAEDLLEKVKIVARDEDGQVLETVKCIKDALSYETELDSKSYIKSGRDWFEILEDFKNHINGQIASLPVEADYMPAWSHDNEDAYNKSVADTKNWGLLDKKCIMIEGYSRIEICDLYDSEKKRFIHVKKTWGSQSSYLYLQASTSALTYNDSSDFRQKCKEKWSEYFDGSHTRDQSTVVIAVACEKSKIDDFPNNLSYFAKTNLNLAATEISSSGFNVCLAPIEIVDNPNL